MFIHVFHAYLKIIEIVLCKPTFDETDLTLLRLTH